MTAGSKNRPNGQPDKRWANCTYGKVVGIPPGSESVASLHKEIVDTWEIHPLPLKGKGAHKP